jgi:hypothetical protein
LSTSFQVERLADVRGEWERYFPAHYEELATLKQHITQVDPDWGMYERLDAAGILHIVTVRDGGALVGYYMGAVLPQPHYKSVVFASADVYYLDPAYRKGFTGIKFLKFIEESLRARGVQMIVMGTKLSKDLGKLYEALGYVETDRVFRKWLA